MTVRRDITAMEATGHVASVRGGVRLVEWQETLREPEFRARLGPLRERAIAEPAAQSIEDDMVLFLDAGGSCQSLVPLLAVRRHLTVVTTDFNIVTRLLAYPNIEVMHTGGQLEYFQGSHGSFHVQYRGQTGSPQSIVIELPTGGQLHVRRCLPFQRGTSAKARRGRNG